MLFPVQPSPIVLVREAVEVTMVVMMRMGIMAFLVETALLLVQTLLVHR
jgi:hypothetical protein